MRVGFHPRPTSWSTSRAGSALEVRRVSLRSGRPGWSTPDRASAVSASAPGQRWWSTSTVSCPTGRPQWLSTSRPSTPPTAGLSHGVPVQRSGAEHLHGQLRGRRSEAEQHHRRSVCRANLHLQRCGHRRARRPRRLVRCGGPRLPTDVAGAGARHAPNRYARRGDRCGIQRQRRRPRSTGARCRFGERHRGEPCRARLT